MAIQRSALNEMFYGATAEAVRIFHDVLIKHPDIRDKELITAEYNRFLRACQEEFDNTPAPTGE